MEVLGDNKLDRLTVVSGIDGREPNEYAWFSGSVRGWCFPRKLTRRELETIKTDIVVAISGIVKKKSDEINAQVRAENQMDVYECLSQDG